MKKDIKSYMHVALVLDASGSMESIRTSTVKSLKSFFAGMKSEEDKTLLDVWQFSDTVKHLVDGADLNKGAPQTLENYTTEGCTSLYDAVCVGIDELGRKFAAMPESERPDGVVFAVLTDGFENASTDFTVEDVKNRIEHQSKKYNWEFRFLAANQDAVTTGAGLGIAARACSQIVASDEGMADLCAPSGSFAKCMREARLCARSMRVNRRKR